MAREIFLRTELKIWPVHTHAVASRCVCSKRLDLFGRARLGFVHIPVHVFPGVLTGRSLLVKFFLTNIAACIWSDSYPIPLVHHLWILSRIQTCFPSSSFGPAFCTSTPICCANASHSPWRATDASQRRSLDHAAKKHVATMLLASCSLRAPPSPPLPATPKPLASLRRLDQAPTHLASLKLIFI